MNIITMLPSAVLTTSDSFLVGPISQIFASILNFIFNLIHTISPANSLALSIVVFTVLIKFILMPLMINQQKSMRRMQQIQPIMQKVQKKYEGKKDPESQQKMQAEMQKIYKKHKVNPFGGCLPMLIQLPIFLAMYSVFRYAPGYIANLNEIYTAAANQIMTVDGWQNTLYDLVTSMKLAIQGLPKTADAYTMNHVIDIIYQLPSETIQSTFPSVWDAISSNITKGEQITSLFGIFNLSTAPGWGLPGVLIPVFAGATTFVQSKLMSAQNKKKKGKNAEPNQAEQTQKIMTTVFPIMFLFISATTPAGLSIYWITSNIFQIVQQKIINNIMDKEEAARKEEIRKKRLEEGDKPRKRRPRPTNGTKK